MVLPPLRALRNESGRPERAWVEWLWVAMLLAAYGWVVVSPALQRQTHGFIVLYTSARLVLQGDQAALYDDPAFNQAISRYGVHGIYDINDANPPTAALLLIPIASLPPGQARTLWILINAGLLVLTALLIAGLLLDLGLMPPQARRVSTAGVLAALLVYHPLAVNFALGQAYLLLLLLLAAAVLALLRNHPLLAGLALAGIVAIKGYYGVLLLLLIPARQWRALGAACGASLALAVASLPLLSASAWAGYLRSSGALAHNPSSTVTAYQTLHGLIGHLLWRDARWNPSAPLDLPALADALWLLGAAALLLLPPVLSRGGHLDRRSWAQGMLLMVPTALLAAPMAEEYHYTLLALPLLVLWVRALTGRASVAQVGLLALATALAASPLPTYGRALRGAASLLYYSKLAAAVLVLIVLVSARREPRHLAQHPARA